MTAIFPTAVWDGAVRKGRANANTIQGPDGYDWLTMVKEIQAMQRICDGCGLSTAGALATSDPSITGHFYADPSTGANEVQSLAAIASVSGTWKLTITLPENVAIQTAAIAYDATAATIETAIDTALAGKSVRGVAFTAGDITCAGGAINANPVTLTYDGNSVKAQNIVQCSTADVDLSDNTPPVASTTTPGVLDNAIKLSSAGAATYPNVWDGTTPVRTNVDAVRAPVWEDWLKLVSEIVKLELRVLPLGLGRLTGVATTDPQLTNGWLKDAANVAISVGAGAPTTWDGLSRTRTSGASKSAPDAWDYQKAFDRLLAMQQMLYPLGFDADGRVPTSDPSVPGELYTSTGTLMVSA